MQAWSRVVSAWYKDVSGDELQQGDVLRNCSIVVLGPTTSLPQSLDPATSTNLPAKIKYADGIVLSQTCDLVAGRGRINQVVLCRVAAWNIVRKDDKHPLANASRAEEARRGRMPAYHILNECQIDGLECERLIVHFGDVFTVPTTVLVEHANNIGRRLRLVSPYREQLSQAFARFFMRVALQDEIAAFK